MPIGMVAERTGLNASALRFYEERGLIRSTRTNGGRRTYAADVLRRLGFIQAAQRVGLTLDEIGEALAALPPDRAPTARQWSQLASEWKPMLEQRIRLLEALRDSLDACIGCGCLSLEICQLFNPGDEAGENCAGPRYLPSFGAEEFEEYREHHM
jgi:MerR family transcriptional regulator, redox-sensitive transcriptional activator SoxR